MSSHFLENFDRPHSEEAPPPPSFEEGYVSGFEAGQAEMLAQNSLLEQQLVEDLKRIDTANKDAEERVLSALAPMFRAIVTQLLPSIAEEVIGPQVCEVLLMRAESCALQSRYLRLSPDDITSVEEVVSSSGISIPIILDPTLKSGQAILGHQDSEDFFDFDEVVSAIRGALSALILHANGESLDE